MIFACELPASGSGTRPKTSLCHFTLNLAALSWPGILHFKQVAWLVHKLFFKLEIVLHITEVSMCPPMNKFVSQHQNNG